MKTRSRSEGARSSRSTRAAGHEPQDPLKVRVNPSPSPSPSPNPNPNPNPDPDQVLGSLTIAIDSAKDLLAKDKDYWAKEDHDGEKKGKGSG